MVSNNDGGVRNMITNAVKIYDSPSGAVHFMASNNDGGVRIFDMKQFQLTKHFRFEWSVNTKAAATKSLELDGTKMGNKFVKIERCRLDPGRKRKSEFLSEPQKADGCLSAYVGNLAWGVTEEDIRDYFEESKIASLRFAIDKKTGMSRGFCHIDFEDDESLENAMKTKYQ